MTLNAPPENAICLIPARGGSKRIPRKNIRPFRGTPMITWPIRAAKASGLFSDIMVSTDDQEITRIAQEAGASVPFLRPADLSDDHATTDMVILHALDWLRAKGLEPRYLCCIYPCTPFLTPDDLKRGLQALSESQATTAFSVVSYGHPIFRALTLNNAGRLEMFWPENRLTRSQDLPEAWHDAGQFYWLDIPRYIHEPRIFSANSVPVIMPSWRAIDIDTLDDWKRLEMSPV